MSVALGFVEWATLFLQELVHGSFDLRGPPAVMRERPPVCVTNCKSLHDHLLAVGSPTTLQGKRSAVDLLIMRESLKKTGCVIRWAPTGLQLADGLTKDKGEAVECLRRSLRSGSYVLRSEKQVMHERQLSRTSKKLEEKSAVEQSWLSCCVEHFWKFVINVQQLVLSSRFFCKKKSVLISIRR